MPSSPAVEESIAKIFEALYSRLEDCIKSPNEDAIESFFSLLNSSMHEYNSKEAHDAVIALIKRLLEDANLWNIASKKYTFIQKVIRTLTLCVQSKALDREEIALKILEKELQDNDLDLLFCNFKNLQFQILEAFPERIKASSIRNAFSVNSGFKWKIELSLSEEKPHEVSLRQEKQRFFETVLATLQAAIQKQNHYREELHAKFAENFIELYLASASYVSEETHRQFFQQFISPVFNQMALNLRNLTKIIKPAYAFFPTNLFIDKVCAIILQENSLELVALCLPIESTAIAAFLEELPSKLYSVFFSRAMEALFTSIKTSRNKDQQLKHLVTLFFWSKKYVPKEECQILFDNYIAPILSTERINLILLTSIAATPAEAKSEFYFDKNTWVQQLAATLSEETVYTQVSQFGYKEQITFIRLLLQAVPADLRFLTWFGLRKLRPAQELLRKGEAVPSFPSERNFQFIPTSLNPIMVIDFLNFINFYYYQNPHGVGELIRFTALSHTLQNQEFVTAVLAKMSEVSKTSFMKDLGNNIQDSGVLFGKLLLDYFKSENALKEKATSHIFFRRDVFEVFLKNHKEVAGCLYQIPDEYFNNFCEHFIQRTNNFLQLEKLIAHLDATQIERIIPLWVNTSNIDGKIVPFILSLSPEKQKILITALFSQKIVTLENIGLLFQDKEHWNAIIDLLQSLQVFANHEDKNMSKITPLFIQAISRLLKENRATPELFILLKNKGIIREANQLAILRELPFHNKTASILINLLDRNLFSRKPEDLGLLLAQIFDENPNVNVTAWESAEKTNILINICASESPWSGEDYAVFLSAFSDNIQLQIEVQKVLKWEETLQKPNQLHSFFNSIQSRKPEDCVHALCTKYTHFNYAEALANKPPQPLVFNFIATTIMTNMMHKDIVLKKLKMLPLDQLKTFCNYFINKKHSDILKSNQLNLNSLDVLLKSINIKSYSAYTDYKILLIAACCFYYHLRKQDSEYSGKLFGEKGKSKTIKLQALPHLIDLILYGTSIPEEVLPIVKNGRMNDIYSKYKNCPDNTALCALEGLNVAECKL